ncbi:MAG: hypothetical protein COB02_10180 [Candidatus Cloacimonadota bacterium]|nr:MAG: hypothetical protein COB02_10180 [Candidatus Cloacimonadota bacterium]
MEELEVENLEEMDQVLNELLDQIPEDRKSKLLEEANNSSSDEVEDLLSDISKEDSAPTFSEILEEEEMSQLDNGVEPLLTEEERSYFFEATSSENSDEDHFKKDFIDIQSIDENQEIYEEVILSPVLQDTRRLYFMCLGTLMLLLGFVTILCFLEYNTQVMILENRANIKTMSKAVGSSEFLNKNIIQQKQEILLKLNSVLSSKEEKALCNFFLASFAYQEGNMKAGRKYMLAGVKLRDDK